MQLRATRLTAIASAVKRAFNISSLFAGGVQGVWYDPSDYSTLFQDSAGTTPVTAVEQPVGLMLDKSKGATLGPELLTNGSFTTDLNGWTVSATLTNTVTWVSSGAARLNIQTISGDCSISQGTFVSGQWYKLSFTATLISGGAIRVQGPLPSAFIFSTTGNYVQYFQATTTGALTFTKHAATAVWDITNVKIAAIPGNHAFQSTSASRPVLSARYNLLTKTEQFNDAVWTKQEVTLTVNATTSPIGGSNGTSIVPTATTNQFRIYRNPDPSVSAQNGIYVKANGYTKVALRDAGGTSGMYAAFDLASVSVINPGSSANASIVSAGNGWFKISAVFTTAANQRFSLHVLSPSYVSGVVDVPWTANGTDGIYIWGASLVPTNQSTLPYQRVNTSTDYATTGFLPYLKFDGVDDSLSTNSINFTSTDKMSVFAGVRKLSDSGIGFVAELSANGDSTNGTFGFAAPVNESTYYAALRGTTLSARKPATAINAPITSVVEISYALSQTYANEITMRVNASQIALSTASGQVGPAGTGNFSNNPLYIGRRYNVQYPFNGQIYSMIIVGKAVNAVELTSTEKYTAAKTGVTL